MRTSLLVMFNETYKRILIVWDYKFNVLVQLIMIGIIFLGASFLLGGGQFNPEQLTSLFLGYIVWFYARIVIMSTSSDILGEAESEPAAAVDSSRRGLGGGRGPRPAARAARGQAQRDGERKGCEDEAATHAVTVPGDEARHPAREGRERVQLAPCRRT